MNHGTCPVGIRDHYFINCLAGKNCEYAISHVNILLTQLLYDYSFPSSRCNGNPLPVQCQFCCWLVLVLWFGFFFVVHCSRPVRLKYVVLKAESGVLLLPCPRRAVLGVYGRSPDTIVIIKSLWYLIHNIRFGVNEACKTCFLNGFLGIVFNLKQESNCHWTRFVSLLKFRLAKKRTYKKLSVNTLLFHWLALNMNTIEGLPRRRDSVQI